MKYSRILFSMSIAAALLTVSACSSGHSGTVSDASVKEATKTTQDKNKKVYALLDFSDEQEREFYDHTAGVSGKKLVYPPVLRHSCP